MPVTHSDISHIPQILGPQGQYGSGTAFHPRAHSVRLYQSYCSVVCERCNVIVGVANYFRKWGRMGLLGSDHVLMDFPRKSSTLSVAVKEL
jgi:hypothetical protein